MAVIKRTDLQKLGPKEREAKIAELTRAMLELRGEGRKDKIRPLRKAIAKLKTPPATPQAKAPANKA